MTHAARNIRILPDRTDPTNKADKYVYDYRNRLIEIWHTTQYNVNTPESSACGDDPAVSYFYDGLNRLVKKHLTSGTDTINLYDGWRCIEERELDGEAWEARRQYVYGGIYIDHTAARLRQASEPLIFDKDTNTDGNCEDAGGSARYFYCQQANYNVVAMTESGGDVVEKIKYDPYGERSFILDGSTGNPYLFQGQRYDLDAGLYYFRNRWYHPVLGRFMQRDPEEYVDGQNLYEFVEGSPADLLDYMGTRLVDFYGQQRWGTHAKRGSNKIYGHSRLWGTLETAKCSVKYTDHFDISDLQCKEPAGKCTFKATLVHGEFDRCKCDGADVKGLRYVTVLC